MWCRTNMSPIFCHNHVRKKRLSFFWVLPFLFMCIFLTHVRKEFMGKVSLKSSSAHPIKTFFVHLKASDKKSKKHVSKNVKCSFKPFFISFHTRRWVSCVLFYLRQGFEITYTIKENFSVKKVKLKRRSLRCFFMLTCNKLLFHRWEGT